MIYILRFMIQFIFSDQATVIPHIISNNLEAENEGYENYICETCNQMYSGIGLSRLVVTLGTKILGNLAKFEH